MKNVIYSLVGTALAMLTVIVTGCTCEPDCNGAAQALASLCDYEEIEAQLYYNGCTAYTLGDDVEMCRDHADETECILAATSCEEALICQ